jgi:hypothetical protein
MGNLIQQTGTFRGRIISYGLHEAESGACSVKMTVAIDEIFHENAWHDWRGEDIEAMGEIWIVRKDGNLNENGVKSLVNAAGWDGSLLSISEATWDPNPVQIQVEADTYKDETRYRISYVNDYERTPGGGNVTLEKAKELQARLGSSLRALVGNSARNQVAAPAAKPAKPVKPAKPAPQPVAEEVLAVAEEDGEVPF